MVPTPMATTTTRILDGHLVLATATIDTPDGPFVGGACSVDEDDALRRATGEAVERTTLLAVGPTLVVPATGIDGDGGGAADAGPARPEIVAGAAAPAEWVPATGVRSAAPVWLPADLVLLRWHGSRPLPVRQTSVGSAAHPDRDRAVAAGVRECLERWAVRQVWSGTTALVEVTAELAAALPAGLAAALAAHGLAPRGWLVGAARPVPVVVVMVAGARGGRVTFGAACRASLADGLRHALCEAVGMRAALAGSRALDGGLAAADGQVDLAVRASAFGSAFEAFLGQLATPPPGAGDPGEDPVSGGDGADAVAFLRDRFGVEPVVVDLGSREGLHVVKVVVPAAEMFVPRHTSSYVLAPGYLE